MVQVRGQITISIAEKGEDGDAGENLGGGKMLHRDPEFRKGTNNCVTYNNLQNGSVAVTRIIRAVDCPTTSSHCLEVKTIGAAVPNHGGYYQYTKSRPNAIFIQKVIAKIPIGYLLNIASNSMGSGYKDSIIGNNLGSGRYEVYLRKTICGTSGYFSGGGYFYLSGGAIATVEAPLIWYIASSTVYDMTDSEKHDDAIIDAQAVADAITEKAHNEGWATKLTYINSQGIFTGKLSANTIDAVCVNASQITSGVVDTSRLNVVELKVSLITSSNINALTLSATKGCIGGWSISATQISKNSISLGGDGSISNGTKWQFNNDGSGRFASGNISWDISGNVIFSSAVKLSWTAPISGITTALGGVSYSKLTNITPSGIYTGTLSATQVNAVNISASSIKTGTLSADRIAAGSITSVKLDATSIRANIINVSYINGLACTFARGEIGGWSISGSSISKNSVYFGADGSIYNGSKWRLDSDGSGSMASGNISWSSAGTVSFSLAVSLLWKQDIVEAQERDLGYPHYKSIIINGDENSYYPVIIKGGDQNFKRDILVKRSYSDQAPDSWNNSTHKGSLLLLLKSNFGGWGGINYSWEIDELSELYCRMFAGALQCGNSCMFAIFLRGGGVTGAKYHIYSDQPLDSNLHSPSPIPPSPQIAYSSNLIFHYLNYKAYAPAPRTMNSAVEEEIRRRLFIPLAQNNDTTLTQHPLTHIDANGIYTGTLTAHQINAVTISANSITTGAISGDRIAAGSITSAKLDANSIKANIINTSYINGLSCTFARGIVGGWSIGTDNLTHGVLGRIGATPIQLRTTSEGSGYWYNGTYKPIGISMFWLQSANAGHIVIGQIAASGNSVKTNFAGIQMMSWDHKEYFCLSVNFNRAWSKEIYNRIAGWAFDSTRIWKNSVSLGADGSIANGTKWQFNNSGSGQIAAGNTTWSSSGVVAFSSSVSLTWTAPIGKIVSALGGSSYPKLTKITSSGIYTGSLTASQITAGTISAYRIDTNAIKTSILTATNINALSLTTAKGSIGGWSITLSQISKNSVILSSSGYITNGSKWRLNSDGSGQLATGNISWNSSGKVVCCGEVEAHTLRTEGVFITKFTTIVIGTSQIYELLDFNEHCYLRIYGHAQGGLFLRNSIEFNGYNCTLYGVNYAWMTVMTGTSSSNRTPIGGLPLGKTVEFVNIEGSWVVKSPYLLL